MFALIQPFALLANAVTSLGHTSRYEDLFSLSEAQLKARGLDRDGLVRGYVSSLGHS